MIEPNKPRGPSAAQSGFSLATLALMVTVVAMVFASASVKPSREQLAGLVQDGAWRMWALFVGAAIVGALIGLAHMLIHGFSWHALVFSLLSGALAGCLGAMLLIAPGSIRQALVAAVAIIGTTVVFRLGVE